MISLPDCSRLLQPINKINVSLALPGAHKLRAIKASLDLSQEYSTEFVLDGESNYPHITICTIAFPMQNIVRVWGTVNEIANKHAPVRCVPSPELDLHQRYLGVSVDKTPQVLQLHEDLLLALAPLRVQEENAREQYKMSLTPKQIQYIEKYGYPDAFELYDPHFTLTRFMEGVDAESAIKGLKWDEGEFESSMIGVYLSGDHGTCSVEMKQFPLIG